MSAFCHFARLDAKRRRPIGVVYPPDSQWSRITCGMARPARGTRIAQKDLEDSNEYSLRDQSGGIEHSAAPRRTNPDASASTDAADRSAAEPRAAVAASPAGASRIDATGRRSDRVLATTPFKIPAVPQVAELRVERAPSLTITIGNDRPELVRTQIRVLRSRAFMASRTRNFESYGPPSLHIGALRIWVHGRQFPDSADESDGNWLNVSAHYAADGAGVRVSGSLLETVDFLRFETELRALYKSLTGAAVLESFEPELMARIDGGGMTGRMRLRIEMTANPLSQGHWFEQEIDQSYLPSAIAACAAILTRYPVRGRSTV